MKRRPLLAAAAILASSGGAAALFLACGEPRPKTPTTAETARAAFDGFYRPPTDRIPHELATNPGTPWGDWTGSGACKSCHAKEYAGWRDSFHSRTLYDAVDKTVFGDFGEKAGFANPEFAYAVKPSRSGDAFWMTVEANPAAKRAPDTYGAGVPKRPLGRFRVMYAFGNRRHQPYVTRDDEGRTWVLPVYWNDVEKRWLWDGWRPYVTNCAPCHTTGIRSTGVESAVEDAIANTNPQRWTLPPKDEGWAEGAVGCEVCHGPGRPHVRAVERMGVEGYRAYLASGGAPTIYDPDKADRETRMSQCDTCHSFFSESSVTWVPRPTGYDHVMLRRPITAQVSPEQFWVDGTDMSPCTVGRVFRESPMGRAKKAVECRDCHDSHGNADWAELVRPLEGNRLCLGCHGDAFPDAKALAAHTHHGAGSPGSLCAECHMPRDKRFTNGVQVMSAQIRSHAFSTPTGKEDEVGGPGPSCNTCHTDRDAAWTRAVLSAWRSGTAPPR